MTIYELRLVVVLGLLALGALALLGAYVATRLKDLVPHADTRTVASRETARLIDGRQAAWRQRC